VAAEALAPADDAWCLLQEGGSAWRA
jgi:hypothetical protein